jgi:hypothetical protein
MAMDGNDISLDWEGKCTAVTVETILFRINCEKISISMGIK